MSTFPLFSVPGFAGTLDVADNAANVNVQVALKDPILFLPGNQTLAMQASHRRLANNAHELTLRAAGLNVSLCGGQIVLTAITAVIQFADAGTPRFDSVAGAIQVTGDATWTGSTLIGIAGGVALRLGYTLNPGISGAFTLTLANPPLNLPLNVARLDSGELRLELPANKPVARLTVSGAVSLTSQGNTQARQLLTSALGSAATLRPVGGTYTVELGLQGGRPPANAAPSGSPSLQIQLDWPQNFAVPALPNIPDGLAVDLGLPILQFPLGPAGPAAGADWSIGFRDSAIRFPTIPGFAGLRLDGSLLWETGPTNRFMLAPGSSGSFQLPDIFRIFLSQLGWQQSPFTLDKIRNAASASLPELEWEDIFRGLIPSPLPSTSAAWAAFEDTLRQTLQAAAAALDINRVFAAAFRAFALAGDELLALLWKIWFSLASVANPLGAAPAMLAGLLAGSPGACDAAFNTLYKLPPPGFDLTALIRALFDYVGQHLDLPTLELWARSIILAINSLAQDSIGALVDAIDNAYKSAAWIGGLWSAIAPATLAAISASFFVPNFTGLQFFPAFLVLMLAYACRGVLDFLESHEPFATMMHGVGNLLSTPLPELSFGRFLSFLQSMLFPRQGLTPEQRRAREEQILCAANQQPLFGLLLALFCLPVAFLFNQSEPLDLMTRPVNTQSGRKVNRLPKGKKYLILSDIHRDAERDKLPPLQVGSIYHFASNADLFCDVLDWADTNGFIVLEGGDCEELWFIRDPVDHALPDPLTGYTGFKKQLDETIKTYPQVYDRLRKLHHQDRYFRIFGNHDSYLRDPDMLAVLKAEMEAPVAGLPVKPFDIWDYFVIDDVKSMTESRVIDTITSGRNPGSIGALLTSVGLGMDSRDYQERCSMLVTHGHQWDFFNCDTNNMLGKLIANSVAVPVDRAMDLAIDVRGVAFSGSPTCDFQDFLGGIFLLNNWPAEEPAVKFAHAVQHMPNGARILADGIMYRESVAAILGTMFTAINWRDPSNNTEVTPEQSQQDWVAGRITSGEYVKRHHNHHICIGHTHNPQSQPYFRLLPFIQELPFMRDLVTLADTFFPLKSGYLNSGTCGWMDGVVWGILVDDDVDDPHTNRPFQARLVFWTRNTRGPEFMDWELKPLDPAVKQAIANRLPGFPPFTSLDDFFDFVGELLRPATDAFAGAGFDLRSGATKDKLKLTYPIPAATLWPAIDEDSANSTAVVMDLSEVTSGDPEEIGAALDKMQSAIFGALLTSLGRGRTASTAAKRDFILRVPVDASLQTRVNSLAGELASIAGATAATAVTVAGLMDNLLRDFPANLPFFGLSLDRFNPLERLARTSQPVLSAALAMVPLMRLVGPQIHPHAQPIAYSASFTANDKLEFKLTVGR